MNKKILLGLVIPLLLVFTFMVSAIDVSYSDSYLPKDRFSSEGITSGDVDSIKVLITDKEADNNVIKSTYPKVQINEDRFLGIFPGDKIMDLELIDHTEYCTVNCYSILQVNLYQKTKLMDQLETRSQVGNQIVYTNNIPIKTYVLKNVSYIIEEQQYENTCNDIIFANKTFTICTDHKTTVKNTLGWKEEFVEYHNEELDAGSYVVKIVGKKSFNQVIDWVPTIQNQKIEALAWWNITEVYGNGSMGDVYFSTSTKTYGNMVLNQDYTIGGNTLYLMTDRVYNFNTFYLGSGTTLSTNNVTGSVVYLMAKESMILEGTVTLSGRLQPGQYNATSFSYLGDSFTTPSVAEGAPGFSGSSTAGGFGGGGNGGTGNAHSCTASVGAIGGNGSYPFGNGGSGATATSSNDDNCRTANGNNGLRSGGGGGGGVAYTHYAFCTITSIGANGGNNYGSNGGNGVANGQWFGGGYCDSGAIALGGGGAGGSAGIPGLNLVLRAQNMTILSSQISLSGGGGGIGGNGGAYMIGSWGGTINSWSTSTGASGTGGGGGGGASAGNLTLYYRYLMNDTALTSKVLQSRGTGGTGGGGAGGSAGTGSSGFNGNITIYEEGYTTTTLLNPANGSNTVTPAIINFTATVNPVLVTLLNSTFYLYNNNLLNNTQYTLLSGTDQVNLSWSRTAAQMPIGNYSWAVKTCWTDGTVPKCDQTQNNSFTTFSTNFHNSTYNNITYEMLYETYSVNITSTGFVNLSGTLVWDGTEYPAVTSGNNVNATFTSSLWIPTGPGTKSFHWHIFYGGQLQESIPEFVQVYESQYNICNSSLNVPYYIINYRDETTNQPINASVINSVWNYNVTGSPYGKQLTYSNLTVALNHQFCFNPSYAPLNIPSANYQYGNPAAGYSTKLWYFSNLFLTNSSTTVTLFLINLIDSGTTPVTFQTINSQSNVIIGGIRVSTFRTVGGTSTMVNDGYTDTAGTIAYFMSPIAQYTVVASGGGCQQLTSTITPTSNQYNLLLNCASSTAQQFTSQLDGVTYQRTPQDGVTMPGMNTYTYSVNSITFNMTRVMFQLINAVDRTVLATNDSLVGVPGCSSSSCKLTLNYRTYNGDNIKGRYLIAINGTSDTDLILLEGDAYWRFVFINQTNSLNSIGRAMLNAQEFFNSWGAQGNSNCLLNLNRTSCQNDANCKWISQQVWVMDSSVNNTADNSMCVSADNINKIEFSRIVTIFFFIIIALFILGRTTGYELNHPGSFVVGMSGVIWILSVYRMFEFAGLTQYAFFNQYIFALTTSCIAAGYTISVIRRYSG